MHENNLFSLIPAVYTTMCLILKQSFFTFSFTFLYQIHFFLLFGIFSVFLPLIITLKYKKTKKNLFAFKRKQSLFPFSCSFELFCSFLCAVLSLLVLTASFKFLVLFYVKYKLSK